MKKFKSFLALVATLAFALITPSIEASTGIYNKTVSVSSTATTVTPTVANPTWVNVRNDGSVDIFVDFDRPAVASSTTAVRVKACEMVDIALDSDSFTYASLITTSSTASAQLTAHYLKGTFPSSPATDRRMIFSANPACSTTSTSVTVNGASWVPYVDSESITLDTGALTTDSAGNLLHANSLIDAVVCTQTTAITTSTNWGISDPTTANRFKSATTIATTSLVGLDQWDPDGAAAADGPKQLTAAKLRITVTVANPGAGVVRCSVFGRSATAPIN